MPGATVPATTTRRAKAPGASAAPRSRAVIAAADDDHLTGQAQFEIDRTAFGSQYGSGRLFAFLGRHVVNDHVHLHVKLNATRQPG